MFKLDTTIRLAAGNALGLELKDRLPDKSGSNTEIFLLGDKALRISISEECNKALKIASERSIPGLVKCFDYAEIDGNESYPFIDAAIVSRLEVLKLIPIEITQICELIESGNPMIDDIAGGLAIADKFDNELKQGLEFVCQYAQEVGWDADISESNFMVDPVRKRIVISDPMV